MSALYLLAGALDSPLLSMRAGCCSAELKQVFVAALDGLRKEEQRGEEGGSGCPVSLLATS